MYFYFEDAHFTVYLCATVCVPTEVKYVERYKMEGRCHWESSPTVPILLGKTKINEADDFGVLNEL
jgi:hypothetical protein